MSFCSPFLLWLPNRKVTPGHRNNAKPTIPNYTPSFIFWMWSYSEFIAVDEFDFQYSIFKRQRCVDRLMQNQKQRTQSRWFFR